MLQKKMRVLYLILGLFYFNAACGQDKLDTLAVNEGTIEKGFPNPSSFIKVLFENNKISTNVFEINDIGEIYLLTTKTLGEILRDDFKEYNFIENSRDSGRGFSAKYQTVVNGDIFIFSEPSIFEANHSGATPIIVFSNLRHRKDNAKLILYTTTATSRKVPTFNYIILTCYLQYINRTWLINKVRTKKADFVKLY